VISSDCWIGNYIYGVRWIFRQDGAIKAEVDLTGTLLLRGVTSEQEGNAYGTAVAPYLSAPDHQHFFSFRLDFDIDGEANSLVEINTHPIVGNVFSTVERPLRSELEARRDLNLRTNRYWKVINPSVRNAAGHPSGFSLWPSDSARPYASVENPGRKYAGFIDHHLWATAYDPEQMYAAGPYPNQSTVADGLPLWTADDDSLDNRDLVLWYTVGITHHPRVEEYPVMSAHHLNFLLRPEGLLSQNPALDIPPKSRAR
jgi:primary-amine oxidase